MVRFFMLFGLTLFYTSVLCAEDPHPSQTESPPSPTKQKEDEMAKETAPIYFLTSNVSKFEEVRAIIPNVKILFYDLPEIQEIDPRLIIQAKLIEAFKYREGQFIVEDTSLYLDALNGLPGPLIKWFQIKLGNQGIVDIAYAMGNDKAEAATYIGYAKNPKEIHYFEGHLKGRIVPLRGDQGFGWDAIFQPEGQTKTFAEMDPVVKNAFSMRRYALEQLKAYLEAQPD